MERKPLTMKDLDTFPIFVKESLYKAPLSLIQLLFRIYSNCDLPHRTVMKS